jgi:hypothetical protein
MLDRPGLMRMVMMRIVVTRMVVRTMTIRSGVYFADRPDCSQRGGHGNCYSESSHHVLQSLRQDFGHARQTKQRSLIRAYQPGRRAKARLASAYRNARQPFEIGGVEELALEFSKVPIVSRLGSDAREPLRGVLLVGPVQVGKQNLHGNLGYLIPL